MTKSDVITELREMRKFYEERTLCTISESIIGKKVIDDCIDLVSRIEEVPIRSREVNKRFSFGV